MYDPLLRIGPDGDLVNWAASDYSIDGATVSVTLRDGMTFHDGEPVTGEDVAFTFNLPGREGNLRYTEDAWGQWSR